MYVKDNFLEPDSAILKELTDVSLWEELDDVTYSKLSTFWDGEGELDNVWKRLINKIWGDLDPASFGCFEYWVNILSDDMPLSWHQDKNEMEYIKNNNTICADTSTVFYGYPHKIEGGYLEINEGTRVDNIETERIQPVYNRIVVFDPSRWHRVMPVHEGLRYAFQVNIWNTAPEEAIQLMTGNTYE